MENELTIVFDSEDGEAALKQTGFMKAYLDDISDHNIETNQLRKEIGPGEAGGALLPILTVIAPVAIELIKALASWLVSKESDKQAKASNLKVKVRNKMGDEVEFDATNFSESESELIKKFSESLAHH